MKSSFLSRNPLLAITVALSLIFSMVAVLVPVQQVNAAATNVHIYSPNAGSSSNMSYVKADGYVSVTYYLYGTGVDANAVQIEITNGTTQVGLASVSRVSGAQYTETVHIYASAPAGTYNVIINDGAGHTDTETGAVVVDNTGPTLSLVIPSASTCWQGGTAQNIQWAATDAASADNVTIFASLSSDSGASYTATAAFNVALGQGSQLFTIAVPATTSSTCKMWIFARDRAGNASDNVTSSLFSIYNAGPTPVVVTAPNGGETWNGGSSQTITGTITGVGTTVYYLISLSTDGGGTWSENITSTWQTGTLSGGVYNISYPWTVTNSVRSSNCLIRIQAKYCAGPITADQSNAVFRIKDVTAPTVTVTAPTTGATWYAGSTRNITWTQTDNVPGNLTYCLYYTTDGGANYFLISCASDTQGAKTYAWPIPAGLSSNNCKIKATATDGETPTNTGTAYSGTFTITSDTTPPTVTLCTPNGGESWQVGSLQSITWTASDSPDATARLTYLIELSWNGGTNWATIANLSNQTQCASCGCSYSWAVADNVSTSCLIRITAIDPAGLTATDQSNAVFTITAATCAVETANITLYQGWNLISLPIWPTNTNINSILAPIMPNITSVWYFSGGASGSWYSWAPGAPSTLTTIEGGKAYWFNMATGAPYTLTFQGRKCPCPPSSPTTFSISTTGWNMVGFKSTVAKAVSTYFTSIGTCGTAYLSPINSYNGATQTWTSENCTDSMTVGRGYWVYFNSTGTVSPGCD